jgi:hypothetical protein
LQAKAHEKARKTFGRRGKLLEKSVFKREYDKK